MARIPCACMFICAQTLCMVFFMEIKCSGCITHPHVFKGGYIVRDGRCYQTTTVQCRDPKCKRFGRIVATLEQEVKTSPDFICCPECQALLGVRDGEKVLEVNGKVEDDRVVCVGCGGSVGTDVGTA